MALTSHELILVLRARDEASRVLRHFADGLNDIDKQSAKRAQQQFARGAALATAGVAVAAAGAYAIQALDGMTNAAIEYNQQAAKTLTQVDDTTVSLGDLKQMGIDIGSTMPVQFKEVQDALYDIFSSIETDAPGARKILEGIGRAAVAGAVDMQTSGRAIITILNAWKLGADKVNYVNDVMFQLVRKGVGTYAEFASTIGRAIPSALKAGQSVEDLGGMMAFLTRNGLSAAMASSSAARALDAIAKPNTIARMKDLGVNVTNAKGQFRPMADIVEDLRHKLEGLSPAARAAKLEEIFKGSGGTIQAMRFFNLGVKDSNGLLQELTGNMHDAKGAASAAYDVMANTPEGKLQQMNNQYEIMKTKVGDQLLPIKLKLAEALSKILDWFNKLSPNTQKWIVRIVALAAALAVIVGLVMAVVGVFLMFAAAATMAGVGLGTVAAIVAVVVAAIALLGVAAYMVITHWDQIKEHTINTWNTVKDWVVNTVTTIKNWIVNTWNSIWATTSSIWSSIVAFFTGIWTAITGAIQAGLNFILGIWRSIWGMFGPVVVAVWNFIKAAIELAITAVRVTIHLALQAISNVWNAVWSRVKAFIMPIWNAIYSFVSSKINAVRSVITSVLNAVNSFVSSKMAAIRSVISAAWTFVSSKTSAMWNTIVNTVQSKVDSVMAKVRSLKDRVVGFFSGAINWLRDAGANLIQGLVNGITSKINAATDKMRELTAKLKSFLPGSPIRTGPLKSWNNGGAGKRLIGLIAQGLRHTKPAEDAMKRLGNRLTISPSMTGPRTGLGTGSYWNDRPVANGQVVHQEIKVYTQEIDPLKHAADLGWELAVRI